MSRPATPEPTPAIVLAAGDIADCDGHRRRSDGGDLVKSQPGTVLALGDNAYKFGSADDFAKCYDPSWGQFKDRTHPVLGNHDYRDTAAQAYYDYFGAQAGPRGQGYYSYEVGPWHVIALDSNCDIIDCQSGRSGADVAGARPLRQRRAMPLVYWHHPRFSSGNHGDDQRDAAAWRLLVTAGVEIVLVGHDHDYERFAPIGDKGQLDPRVGIREFVVGTGRRIARHVHPDARAERGARLRLRCSAAGPVERPLRLEVPARRRWHVHRQRQCRLPLRAARTEP